MTGFDSKRRIALDRLDDDDIQVYAKAVSKRPVEADYNSHSAYTRALEAFFDTLAQPPLPVQEPVLQDIEQYCLQIAGISTAAIGYWKEGDNIHPDYDTVALRDVARLYAKYDELYKQMNDRQRLDAIVSVICKYLPPDGTPIKDAMSEIISLVDPLPPAAQPPQRTWVGLTEEDVENLCLGVGTEPIEVRLIEAKLKEKNT